MGGVLVGFSDLDVGVVGVVVFGLCFELEGVLVCVVVGVE